MTQFILLATKDTAKSYPDDSQLLAHLGFMPH